MSDVVAGKHSLAVLATLHGILAGTQQLAPQGARTHQHCSRSRCRKDVEKMDVLRWWRAGLAWVSYLRFALGGSATGEGYVDCGHRTYTEVAKSTWPQAFWQSSESTVDDVIEAFFAYAWKCRSKGFTQPPLIVDFVSALNNLCFAYWLEKMFV